MMRRVLAAFLAASCAPNVLPPPAVPEQVMPPMAASAPAEPNMGVVAIATDEPSIVEEITGHMEGVTSGGRVVSGLTYKTVCRQTPCATDLAFGGHDLRMTSLTDPNHNGTGSITVGPQPIDYRYALGHNLDAHMGGIGAISLGFTAMVIGPVFIGIGNAGGSGPNFTPYGYASLLGGIALTVLGGLLLSAGRGTMQDGTGVQWTPSAP